MFTNRDDNHRSYWKLIYEGNNYSKKNEIRSYKLTLRILWNISDYRKYALIQVIKACLWYNEELLISFLVPI